MSDHDGSGASGDPEESSAWRDLEEYVALPRLGELLAGPDGLLLVSVSALDPTKTSYRTAWWRLDPGGAPAHRLTRSVEGESAAAFLADGRLLFCSTRPKPPTDPEDQPLHAEESEDTGALWCLPSGGGEAYLVSHREGGWTGVAAAREGRRLLLTAPMMPTATDEESDAERRRLRRRQKVTAILHESYPVRSWDHDVGPAEDRLLAVDLPADDPASVEPGDDLVIDPADLRNLVPGAGRRVGSAPSVSRAGDLAVLTWRTPAPRGITRTSIAAVDLVSGAVEILAEADAEVDYDQAVVSDDSSIVICVRERQGTADTAVERSLWLVDRAGGENRRLAEDWDAWPTPMAISPDNRTLYSVADQQGHAPIFAVDLATGARQQLTSDGAHASVRLSWDGRTLYAVRTSYSDPGTVIAIDLESGEIRPLRVPARYPDLPGTLTEVTATAADGVSLRAYLALPRRASAEHPVPLVLWVHGGPLASWSSWSWRWCPWLLVARGYAVLLPDPALSTGYGQDFIERGWADWGGAPHTDLMAITDQAILRRDIDAEVTAAMGGSFGGYMVNWIAGHTDRFRAIVSHASLVNLTTFGPTTDWAWYWSREMTVEMMERNSPHRFLDKISTPMLVVHGDKDYRVPVTEGISLWWGLVAGSEVAPEALPHKFLYFPDENHWVLKPQHARVWYECVLAFLDTHLRGRNFARPETL